MIALAVLSNLGVKAEDIHIQTGAVFCGVSGRPGVRGVSDIGSRVVVYLTRERSESRRGLIGSKAMRGVGIERLEISMKLKKKL